ncbi:MAG: hypothetical protein AMXMBFR36_15340 [Acidobacteriota bacterium]
MKARFEKVAGSRRRARLRSVGLWVLLATVPALVAAAEGVRGEVTVDGTRVVLAYGRASATTMGGDDPVTFVLLTEKPVSGGPEGDMAAMRGDGGAMIALHLRASGKIYQALGLHSEANPTFPSDLPAESLRVSDLRLEGGRIAAVVESPAEFLSDGDRWQFRVELDLPVATD